ncbi:MAG: ThiF family adenylyltransferase [Candidatus Eremiobacteraeota bacterium]|nr:ThiF family adenylyltransferase [Candidatus Eremiobacteraeota bacterium]
MSFTLHETRYRGRELLQKLAGARITVCGAGSLGANLVEQLARCGATGLTVIDRDRLEEQNLATQPYGRSELGGYKAILLSAQVYRALGLQVTAVAKELTGDTAARLLRGSQLVVDCLDNRAGRLCVQEACRQYQIPLLHGGLNGDYAEVVWDAAYTVPSGAGEDVCDYPLARNLVTLTVSTLAESILTWLDNQEQQSWSLTLRDFAIRPWLA